MNATIANTYRDQVNHRVTLLVRIARDEKGRQRALTINEVRYAYLEDQNGSKFYARVPDFGLSDFREASARIHHVGFDGTVHLKNVRLRKATQA